MNIKHILLALTGALLSAAHVSAQTWTEPTAPTEPSDPVSGHVYQVMNAESGFALTGGKVWFTWNTTAMLIDPKVGDPILFTLEENFDGEDNSLGWTMKGYDGQWPDNYVFVSGNGINGFAMHLDSPTNPHRYFELLKQENGFYHIRVAAADDTYGEAAVDGWAEKCWGWGGYDDPTGQSSAIYAEVNPDDGYYCDWYFVEFSDLSYLSVYKAKKDLYALAVTIEEEDLDVNYSAYDSVYEGNDLDALNQAIAELKTQIQQARATKLAQGASADNPVDFTSLLENPSFDIGNISGWTCTFQKGVDSDNPGYQGGQAYTNGSVQISQFIEAWAYNNYNTNRSFAALGDGELSQPINGLPAGLYALECDAIAVQQYQTSENPVEGVELFATDSNREHIQKLATGNNLPEHFKLTFTTDGGYINLGLRTRNTSANWIAADNFRLTYYGNETPQEPQNLDFAWDTPIDNGICTSANDATTNGTPYSGAQPVSAWKVNEDTGYRAGGVFAYGSSPFLGGPGYVAPSTGPTGFNGQALGLVAAWTATLQYTQYVELPAGNYTLRVPVYNADGTGSVVRNLIGFLADNDIEYLATRTSYPVGEWVVEEIPLNLDEPTIGHLSLGYVSNDQGSSSMPHLFIDRMELASNDGQHEYVATVENRVDFQAYFDKGSWGYNINTDEIKSALGISSLAEAKRYAVNADGSWQEDTTNGWRDANRNVCPYDKISGRGMQVTHQDEWEENYYEVQAYPGSNYTPDETYTAQFAYEYNGQAVLLNIIIKFNRYENYDQTGTIAFEGIENNCVRVRLNSTEATEVTIPETDGSLSVTGLASRAFAEAPNLKSIILPASITDVPIDAFEGCRAPAITWQSTSTALPANAFQDDYYGIGTANMLFYVKNRNLAPSGVGNVVVEGATDNVVNLTDSRSPFYCPRPFTADTVSYAHTYGMNTGLEGKAAGWETITLPFDVTKIEYNGKELEPFNTWNANKSTIPFWLYEFSPNGFAPASYIRANTPYIVAMPNNAAYDDKYNINGEVTFKGTTVRASNGMSGTQQGDKVFSPNYDMLQADATLFVINSNSQAFGDRSGSEMPGSKFVAQAGDAHPFEAFFKVSGNNVKGESIAIEFSDATALPQVPFDARLLPQDGAAVYNLSGQLVRRASTAAYARQLLRGLPAGIYVVNGRKVVVGK